MRRRGSLGCKRAAEFLLGGGRAMRRFTGSELRSVRAIGDELRPSSPQAGSARLMQPADDCPVCAALALLCGVSVSAMLGFLVIASLLPPPSLKGPHIAFGLDIRCEWVLILVAA